MRGGSQGRRDGGVPVRGGGVRVRGKHVGLSVQGGPVRGKRPRAHSSPLSGPSSPRGEPEKRTHYSSRGEPEQRPRARSSSLSAHSSPRGEPEKRPRARSSPSVHSSPRGEVQMRRRARSAHSLPRGETSQQQHQTLPGDVYDNIGKQNGHKGSTGASL